MTASLTRWWVKCRPDRGKIESLDCFGDAMKRMILCACIALLAGCVTGPSTQTINARQDYVRAHPNNQNKVAILSGLVMTGMTMDDIEAAGYSCIMDAQSVVGDTYKCTENGSAFSIDLVEYVGFNEKGIAVSVIDGGTAGD